MAAKPDKYLIINIIFFDEKLKRNSIYCRFVYTILKINIIMEAVEKISKAEQKIAIESYDALASVMRIS
ncbi:hypothetical protein A8C56_05140 [Niabella ginsenosidivorans]|uniref:Uncharacterized protein n=1 Tax=Niabella ginsenosidivorans TaxID=1176587 RepID=A0A1A9HYJ2_9BACT|nr:hypothetical protein A8C56_05140 [Niabella ginsenosidivorans]